MLRRPCPEPFVATACLLAVLAGPAAAEPDAPPPAGDAVLHLAAGTRPVARRRRAETNPVVQQMRDAASEMVLTAMNFLGVPYRRGGSSADSGFDCSGFTRYVFENSLGLILPRRADEQARQPGLAQVLREELKPGDLVFFNTMRRAFSHVGIYVGDGKFIHAPRSGGEVRIEDMRQAYWSKRFNGARRARAQTPGPDPRSRPDRKADRAVTDGTIRPMGETIIPLADLALRRRSAAPFRPTWQPPTACWPTAWAGRCATCASR
jgi:cell wall-associated NlpC family hydrolase